MLMKCVFLEYFNMTNNGKHNFIKISFEVNVHLFKSGCRYRFTKLHVKGEKKRQRTQIYSDMREGTQSKA